LKRNLYEVRARAGDFYLFAEADTHIESGPVIHVICMPEHCGELSLILHVVALKLLAYHAACARGTHLDNPRILGKSAIVEYSRIQGV
jgi:glucosamine--fructose-6-phosphate aminotransferase (isomerizing)